MRDILLEYGGLIAMAILGFGLLMGFGMVLGAINNGLIV